MLSYGVVCVILCLAVLVQYRRVTDGQWTDGRTDRHITTAYTASIASRGKNELSAQIALQPVLTAIIRMRQVKSKYIFGIADRILPIHYTTFMWLQLQLDGLQCIWRHTAYSTGDTTVYLFTDAQAS